MGYADKKTTQFLVETIYRQNSNTISQRGRDGWNAFFAAAVGGKIDTMRYLNKKRPGLKFVRTENGHTPLTLAAQRADKKTVKFLMEEMKIGMNGLDKNWRRIINKKLK